MQAVTTKLRSDEKSLFLTTCESIGTTPSNAIRMFVAAFNKRGGFPFDSADPYGFNADTLAAMSDADEGRNLNGPFDTVDAFLASLDED